MQKCKTEPQTRPKKSLEKFKRCRQVVVGEIHCHELLGFNDQELGGGRRGMCGRSRAVAEIHPRHPLTWNFIKTVWSLLTKTAFAEASFRIRNFPPILPLLSRLRRFCEQFRVSGIQQAGAALGSWLSLQRPPKVSGQPRQ